MSGQRLQSKSYLPCGGTHVVECWEFCCSEMIRYPANTSDGNKEELGKVRFGLQDKGLTYHLFGKPRRLVAHTQEK